MRESTIKLNLSTGSPPFCDRNAYLLNCRSIQVATHLRLVVDQFFFLNIQSTTLSCHSRRQWRTRYGTATLPINLDLLKRQIFLSTKNKEERKIFAVLVWRSCVYYRIIVLDCENKKQVPMNLFGSAGILNVTCGQKKTVQSRTRA